MPYGSGKLFYIFDEDEGREYLEYYAHHRIGGDDHKKIYENGEYRGSMSSYEVFCYNGDRKKSYHLHILTFSGVTISQELILICDRVVVALRGIEGAGRFSHLPIFWMSFIYCRLEIKKVYYPEKHLPLTQTPLAQ